tara:strand:- start:655 stop:1293 length:639 start_codon:yes stop_codon:yes gene_type:complete
LKRLFIFLVCIIFIPIGLILLNEFYENEGKYLLKGYKYVNYIRDGDLLQFNEDKIDDFVMIGLNHFLDHRENITKEYLDKCFIGESIIDVQCMYDLKNKNIPILIDDNCDWIYYPHETALKYKDYYLVNHPERFCGSLSFRLHNHYLFKYDGRYLQLIKYILAHKVGLQGKIKMLKVTNNGINYIEEPCRGHKDQICFGLRSEEFFFELNDI